MNMKRTLAGRGGIIITIAALLLTVAPGLFTVVQAQEGPYAEAVMDDDNSLIMHVSGAVESPGEVTVEYGSEGVGPFMTAPVSTNGTDFSVEVMRLRPETEYDYRVYLTAAGSAPELQSEGTFLTGPLPAGLQGADIELVEGTPTYDLVLLDFNDNDFYGMIAIDSEANIVWYYKHDKPVFAIDRTDNYSLVFNEIGDGRTGWSLNQIAPDGTKEFVVEDVLQNGETAGPHGRWHHEVILRPDNKVWTLGMEIRPVAIDGEYTLQAGATIEEWDLEAGTVTRLVSTFDIMDAATDRTAASDVTGGFFWRGAEDQYADVAQDWNHANSLEVLPDGKILVSLRHLNQLIAIEPDFSAVAWRLGGPGSDFTFPEPTDQFWHQHFARMLPDGNILLFDNGNRRPEEQGGQYSRAMVLELDFDTMEARKVWEYRHDPDLYAGCCSNAFRMENGNTLIVFGQDDEHDPPVHTLVEVDPDGNLVAEIQISSEGKGIQYRAYPIASIDGETTAAIQNG